MEYEITTPDGRKFVVTAPEGASEQEILAYAQKNAPTPEKPLDRASTSRVANLVGSAVEPNLSLLTGAVSGPLSGLAGIAGTILPGPQGQGADWVERVQNTLTYKPITEGGKTATEAISYPFRKLSEAADAAGEGTANLTGSPALGAAVNAGIQAGLPMAASRFLPVSPAAETAQGGVSRWLMQKAVKPSTADLESGKATRAFQTMLDEGISATPGGMGKAEQLISALNGQVETAIQNSPARVSTIRAMDPLTKLAQERRMQVNPMDDLNTIRAAGTEFINSPVVGRRTDIPVQLAQELKQGTYKAIGNKAYGEMKSTSIEGQKALARGLREEVANAVPEVKPLLARESDLMNVRDVAKGRTLVSGNRDVQGLAALRIDDPAVWSAVLADRSTAIKSALARMLYGTADPAAVRATTGLAASQAGRPQE